MDSGSHRKAVLQALLVTLLWSSSWVLIKLTVGQIPALTFAGLRYTLAFLVLLPFLLRPGHRAAFQSLRVKDWLSLVALGVLYYAVTQGSQFLGLAYLPAVTVSLLLNFTALVVAWLSLVFLQERLTWLQWGGVSLFLAGVLFYFYPVQFPVGDWPWIGVVLAGVLANAISSVLGRSVNRSGRLPALLVTVVSMGIGSLLLLAAGLLTEDFPPLGWREWGVIAWLAVVNTAAAFTLWNHTLRTLSAVESSIINGTMLIQIAVLAWIFLGEGLTWKTGLGLMFAALGALLVQWKLPAKPPRSPNNSNATNIEMAAERKREEV